MIFQTIASGSAGNCYLLRGEWDGWGYELIIECGVSKKVLQNNGLNLSHADGCLITHSHMDHAKGVKDLIKSAVDCYMSAGTAEELGVSGHRVHIIKSLNQFKIGGWAILPFETVHDTKEPLC